MRNTSLGSLIQPQPQNDQSKQSEVVGRSSSKAASRKQANTNLKANLSHKHQELIQKNINYQKEAYLAQAGEEYQTQNFSGGNIPQRRKSPALRKLERRGVGSCKSSSSGGRVPLRP